MDMQIDTESAPPVIVCRPFGELDAYTVGDFREALAGLAGNDVVVDLSAVPFLDSAGLNALIGGIRRIREESGEVALACSGRSLARLLHTVGFDRVVTITGSVEAACAALIERARPDATGRASA